METKIPKKLLLIVEIILIVLGIACSTCSLVKEINGTNDKTEMTAPAPEMNGEAPEIDGEAPQPQMDGTVPQANGEAPQPPMGGTVPQANGETPQPAMDGTAPEMDGEAPEMDGTTPPQGQPMMNVPQQMLEVGSDAVRYIFMALPILMYLMVGVYSLITYKKPHGDTLRHAMFIFGIYLVIEGIANNLFTCQYIMPVAGALITYMSGRLNKEKKNRVVATVIAILLLGFGILETVKTTGPDFLSIYSNVGNFIIWLIFVYAYFARYQEHIQAGIESDAVVTNIADVAVEAVVEEAVEEVAEEAAEEAVEEAAEETVTE